jgi:hypothetical protein
VKENKGNYGRDRLILVAERTPPDAVLCLGVFEPRFRGLIVLIATLGRMSIAVPYADGMNSDHGVDLRVRGGGRIARRHGCEGEVGLPEFLGETVAVAIYGSSPGKKFLTARTQALALAEGVEEVFERWRRPCWRGRAG